MSNISMSGDSLLKVGKDKLLNLKHIQTIGCDDRVCHITYATVGSPFFSCYKDKKPDCYESLKNFVENFPMGMIPARHNI
jgi:hypothetical protein